VPPGRRRGGSPGQSGPTGQEGPGPGCRRQHVALRATQRTSDCSGARRPPR
jgi:hypothetical protein